MAAVVLGPIVFSVYEVPEKINIGGKQTVAVHKMIGGNRVVDAMGPDDDDISWSGRFQGSNATARARALDALRRSGAQIPLMWGGFFKLVVITSFKGEFERFYQIPYQITITVVEDPAGTSLGGPLSSLTDLVSGDLTAALNLVSVLPAEVGTAIGAIQTAVTAAGDLANAAVSVIAPVVQTVSSAMTVIDTTIGVVDQLIDTTSFAGVVAGGFPVDMANSLVSQMSEVDEMVNLQSAKTYVGRIGVNLAQAGG